MTEPVVADSTCLIGLERVGMLDILPQLFDKISIPPAVHSEFGKQFDWLEQEDLTATPLVTALRMVVGGGEAEAIALAVQYDWLLITDDKQARVAAKRFGLKVIGTVGLLLRAKAGELIAEVKPVLDDLAGQWLLHEPSLARRSSANRGRMMLDHYRQTKEHAPLL